MAGVIFGIIGVLSLIPLGKELFPPSDPGATVVRVILGTTKNISESMSGDTPGIALWDDFGRPIGTTFGSSKILDAGSGTNIKVIPNPGVGNEGATYMSITNGGTDAVCITGVQVTFANGDKTAWAADTAAACPNTGAFVTYSSETLEGETNDMTNSGYCVWIDRDGSNGIPHQGIGIRIPDFGGLISSAQVAAYSNNSQLMCDSGPRFRMYESLRTEEPILVFADQIFKTPGGTDVDPGKIIGNPGVFADVDLVALEKACNSGASGVKNCDKLSQIATEESSHKRAEHQDHSQYRSRPRRYQRQRDGSSSQLVPAYNSNATSMSSNDGLPHHANTTTTKGQNRFHYHCIISSRGQSAKNLCNHPNAYGPSFASTTEGLFCDLADKKLYPICESTAFNGEASLVQGVDVSACFDLSTQRLKSPAISPMTYTEYTEASSGGAVTNARNFTQVTYW